MTRDREFDDQALILDQLTEVSLALSTERDFRKLLDLILSRALLLARCDAGSLYIRVPDDDPENPGPPRLRFVAAQNASVAFRFREAELPITERSLAGHAALTGEPLLIEDAYAIPASAPYRFNAGFDRETGYRTRSLLVLPMTNPKGEVTGVLQLINRKRDPTALLDSPQAVEREVVPFDAATTRLMKAVGSLAAVAVDNARLYENIERLFEGFVKASVTAIEQRDPTTSGHSLRVSALCVGLAEAAGREERGALAGISFSDEQVRELRYAALLHDFGKVGVREHVLVKAKKLYPFEMERIETRLEVARLHRERAILLQKVEAALGSDPDRAARLAALDRALAFSESDLARFRETILRANEPTVLPEGDFSTLQEIAAASFTDREGRPHALLEPREVAILSIRKGSLTEEERLEIESHVTHTYEFLKKIPWTGELRRIPEIAFAHHEKINGRGYPRRVSGTEIPVQSRIMTVADIYDALSASDRPYKRAVPPERALAILEEEARDGFLDPDLVGLFIGARIWTTVGTGSLRA
ncbi:MAG: HD domain-containing phosphohydrolase [Acidobacteriota bacterium]